MGAGLTATWGWRSCRWSTWRGGQLWCLAREKAAERRCGLWEYEPGTGPAEGAEL
jgi:hypothetical protein